MISKDKEKKTLSTIKDETQAPAIKESKTFKLKGKDTNVYNFSINLNKSDISLEAVDMNDISGSVYRNTLSLEKFYKTHKLFKFYEDVKEVFDFFGESFTFRYKDENKQTTILGGIICILFYVIAIIYFILKFVPFYKKKFYIAILFNKFR